MLQKQMNSPDENTDSLPDTVEVTVNGASHHLVWDKHIPLLNALLNAGVDVPYSCCRGTCGTCVCKLEEGEVRLKRNFVLSETHLQQGLILTCVAAPVSESITLNYDEF